MASLDSPRLQSLEALRSELGITNYFVAQTSLEHVIDIITRDSSPAGSTASSLFLSNISRTRAGDHIPAHWEPQVSASARFSCLSFSVKLMVSWNSPCRLKTVWLLTCRSTLRSGSLRLTGSTVASAGIHSPSFACPVSK